MKAVVRCIGVDAGMIIVADIGYLRKDKDSQDTSLGKVIEVPNGNYRVHYEIPETYNGDVCGIEELTVTSGKVLIIDPCYVIGKLVKDRDGWGDWLVATDYGNTLGSKKAFMIDSMGGDGCYEVRLNFVEV